MAQINSTPATVGKSLTFNRMPRKTETCIFSLVSQSTWNPLYTITAERRRTRDRPTMQPVKGRRSFGMEEYGVGLDSVTTDLSRLVLLTSRQQRERGLAWSGLGVTDASQPRHSARSSARARHSRV